MNQQQITSDRQCRLSPGIARRQSQVRPAWIVFAAIGLGLGAACGKAPAPAAAHPGENHDHDLDHDQASGHGVFTLEPRDGPVAPEEWCAEHGVPEDVCTRCNPSLIDGFKKSGDWCGGHGIPESQCIPCNPEVEAYWAALRPPTQVAVRRAELSSPAGLTVERTAHPLRPMNNPLCNVEANQIRLLDASVAEKAGIAVEAARLRPMSVTIEALGEVRYDETRLARITARLPGVITEVPKSVGEAVMSGDLVAVIESAEFGAAKSAYVNARETWRLARSDLDRHHHIHDAIETLIAACAEPIGTGELRKRFELVRIGEAKSRVLGSHAQLELARSQFAREKNLLAGGITSQESFQTAQSDLFHAEANFAATIEAVDLEMEKEHLALARTMTVAEIELNAARRQLQILGVDNAQIAALDLGRVDALSRYELRSPITGRVVLHSAVVGEAVSVGDALFSVADLSSLWLFISLSESDLVSVRLGAPMLFTADGLPGRGFEGSIDWISSEVDDRTRTVRARASLDNEDGLLRPNMFGRVRVIAYGGEELLTVPASAVQTDGCCSLVFIKESDTLYRPRKVSLGATSSGFVQVVRGVADGQTVVTAGSFLLKTEILKGSIGAGCCEVHPGR